MRITADLVREAGIPRKKPVPVDKVFKAEYPREKTWQDTVSNWFRQMGNWLCYHTYRSAHSPKGFPDTICVHTMIGRRVWAELKTEDGEVTDDQNDWLSALAVSGEEVYLWRPSDTDEVQDVLQQANDDAFSLRERGFVPKRVS